MVFVWKKKKIEINNDFSLSLYNEIENMRQSVLNCEIGVNTEEYINYNLNNNKKNEFKINLKKKEVKVLVIIYNAFKKLKKMFLQKKKKVNLKLIILGLLIFFLKEKWTIILFKKLIMKVLF